MSAREDSSRRAGSRRGDDTAKACIQAIVRDQPDESSYDDVLRELAFDRLVRRGLASLERRRFTTDEMRQRVKSWHG